MSIFSILIEQAQQGTIKAHQLLATVKQGDMYDGGERSARINKLGPGRFNVELFNSDDLTKPVSVYKAASPVEAKLTLLDWLISGDGADDGSEPAEPAVKSARRR